MKFQPPKGTRDFLPEEMIKRQFVIDRIREVFELFGFDPLDSPAFESWELLSAKGGGGIQNEIYYFKDKAGRELGLRFDLTVPLSRIVANNSQLQRPFRRYAIGNVWRYDEPQKGRYREFTQADVDTVGSNDVAADAEIAAVDVAIMKALGFKDFVVRINNRRVLEDLLEICDIRLDKKANVFRAIDKLERYGKDVVRNELKIILSDSQIKKILELVSIKGEPEEVIKKAKGLLEKTKVGMEGLSELERLVGYCDGYDVSKYLVIDFSIARGLDYYTGTVYETSIKGFENIGSVGSGGRYEQLVELVGGKESPGVGISFGVERILVIMEEMKLFNSKKTKVKVFVANVSEDLKRDAVELAQKLRENGISCQVNLTDRNLTKQLEYADGLGIPYVVIIGEKELKKGKLLLKDMVKKTQKELAAKELLSFLGK